MKVSSTTTATSASKSEIQTSRKTSSKEVQDMMDERRKDRMKVLTRNLEVCDLLDMRNPQSAAEYAPAVFKHLFNEEERFKYPQTFMNNQTEIDRKKRSYLIDYLIEVHYKFKMQPETLYVTVGLVDRYLIKQPNVPKKDL
jgi:cyclin B